jgi:hypothetical protein
MNKIFTGFFGFPFFLLFFFGFFLYFKIKKKLYSIKFCLDLKFVLFFLLRFEICSKLFFSQIQNLHNIIFCSDSKFNFFLRFKICSNSNLCGEDGLNGLSHSQIELKPLGYWQDCVGNRERWYIFFSRNAWPFCF